MRKILSLFSTRPGPLAYARGSAIAGALLVLISSCSRNSNASLQRLTILPGNVLIDDPASEWIAEAVPIVLQEDLATSRTFVVSVANNESGAYERGASAVLRTTVENRNGRITIEATLTDTSTQRNRQVLQVNGVFSGGLLSSLNALAKQLDSRAIDFSTKSDRALRTYAMAAESASVEARAKLLNDAMAIDPAFGLAYIAAVQTGGSNIAPLMVSAASHRNSFNAFDRARFDALESRFSHAPLTQQANSTAAMVKLAPNDVDAVATLGSYRFLQSDSTGGEQLMRRALELSPGNVNILRQLAEGLLETRRFRDAEKVFAGLTNSPAILYELAVCILLEGDAARANAMADKFATSLYPDVKQAYHATWLALSGQTGKAIDAIQGFDNRPVALIQTAMWQLMEKDFAAAKKSATLAAGLPSSFAALSRLLARGDEPVDRWRDEVNSSALSGSDKQILLGYGFFLYGHYPEAVQIWQESLKNSGGTDLRARAMLASSLDRAGRADEARKILVQPFIPQFGDLYAAVSFGEMRRQLR